MSFLLPKPLGDATTLPFILVCEGYGDAKFFNKFLEFLKIDNCSVGCPSRDVCKEYEGDTDLEKYLHGIRFITRKQGAAPFRGLLVIVDADEKPQEQFVYAVEALKNAGFPVPQKEFILSEQDGLRIGVFLMPGEGRSGTLEHLLLEATLIKTPAFVDCLEQFSTCTGIIPSGTENQQAKMKMSALVGATCKNNPWASPAHVWSDPGNPVPIESKAFDHISKFLRIFVV
ncbi:MAG: hypothetical protein DMG97_38750 [Acidobacteria bacterium]|nr:MAG: hypothetical protein DMG97_38750 [Acidobacteriota bacterium]